MVSKLLKILTLGLYSGSSDDIYSTKLTNIRDIEPLIDLDTIGKTKVDSGSPLINFDSDSMFK